MGAHHTCVVVGDWGGCADDPADDAMADLEVKLEIRDSTQKKHWMYYVVQMMAILACSNTQNPTCGHSKVATCNRTVGIAAQFHAQ